MKQEVIQQQFEKAIAILNERGIHVKRQVHSPSTGSGFRAYLSCQMWHESKPEDWKQACIEVYGPDSGFEVYFAAEGNSLDGIVDVLK